MKKYILMMLLSVFLFTGCSDSTINENDVSDDVETSVPLSEQYAIGDEVCLGDVYFNIYKIDDENGKLYLMTRDSIGETPFSAEERPYDEQQNYKGSLVERMVNRFVDDLEDKGLIITNSGIIDMEDLYDLGFEHSVSKSGLPYRSTNNYEFVKSCDTYWLGGTYRHETFAWAYTYGGIDAQSCEDVYGVRPVIEIRASELTKELPEVDPELTIEDVLSVVGTWKSIGGNGNEYDRYSFDCENKTVTFTFKSPQLSETLVFGMEYVDARTVKIEGVRMRDENPAYLTVVNENKLRLRYVDEEYNTGDYYLIRE